MKTFVLRASAFVLCAAASLVAHAEVACPGTLEVQQRASAPEGWTASYTNEAPRLLGISLFDGPPDNRSGMRYNYRRQIGRELHLIWTFAYSPRSHYLQCQYERTSALITAPLPAGTRGCEVVLERASGRSGTMIVKRNVCR